MEITRRSFLAGVGSITVGLLFARKLDDVLDELVAEQQAEDQLPSAAEIVVVPQAAFRPERLVVASTIAHLFVIEDIQIGGASQFATSCSIPATVFSSDALDTAVRLDTATVGTEIRFRVRYIGNDPAGACFMAVMIGRGIDTPGRMMLPISSGVPLVA